MTLLFVSSIVTIVSVVGHWVFKRLAKRHQSKYAEFSDVSNKFDTISITSCCLTLILLLMVGFTTAAGVVQLPVKEQQYEILTYQLNNGLYAILARTIRMTLSPCNYKHCTHHESTICQHRKSAITHFALSLQGAEASTTTPYSLRLWIDCSPTYQTSRESVLFVAWHKVLTY